MIAIRMVYQLIEDVDVMYEYILSINITIDNRNKTHMSCMNHKLHIT
jgi:hypothetical protein